MSYLTRRGLSRESPRSLQASLANMSATSVQCQGSRRSAYGLFSRPRWANRKQPISLLISGGGGGGGGRGVVFSRINSG